MIKTSLYLHHDSLYLHHASLYLHHASLAYQSKLAHICALASGTCPVVAPKTLAAALCFAIPQLLARSYGTRRSLPVCNVSRYLPSGLRKVVEGKETQLLAFSRLMNTQGIQ